eukprot:m.90517 g.90517  ORF g.90517 m.90517 type:complete len:489 (+) comp26405_c0_seq1:92-1558(+)
MSSFIVHVGLAILMVAPLAHCTVTGTDPRILKSQEEIQKMYEEKFGSYSTKKVENTCDAKDQDCNIDQPGPVLTLINRLRSDPYDQEALIEEAAFKAASSLRNKLDALIIYRHIITTNISDREVWRTKVRLMDGVYDSLNDGARTYRYQKNEIVYKDARDWLGKVALMKQPVKFDGQQVTITTNEKDTKQSVFLIENFVSEDERQRLIAIHDGRVMKEEKEAPPYFCDATGTGYFRDLIREEKAEHDFSSSEMQSRHFLSGFDCLREAASHSWVANLTYGKETDYFPRDYALVDQINARIEKLVQLTSTSGHEGTVTSYLPGQGMSNGTGCTVGAKFSPRKLNAASISISLSAADEGGEENFFYYGNGGKTIVPAGAMLVVFHFYGQECDLQTTRRSENVIQGRKVVYERKYDNIEDPTLPHRATATPLPPSHPAEPRVPYKSVVLCDRLSCLQHFNGDFPMQRVLNDQQPENMPQQDSDGDQEEWGY